MKIEFNYEDINVNVELDHDEIEYLGAGLMTAITNPDLARGVFKKITNPVQEEPEEKEKKLVGCVTYTHRGDTLKYHLVKLWLKDHDIKFEDANDYIGDPRLRYELRWDQFIDLHDYLMENLGDKFGSQIV